MSESEICSLVGVQVIVIGWTLTTVLLSSSLSLCKPFTVSWVDDDGEIKEAPIPEQFMHKLVNGSVTSQVSDLYH